LWEILYVESSEAYCHREQGSRDNLNIQYRQLFPKKIIMIVAAILFVGILLSLFATQYFLNNYTETQEIRILQEALTVQWNATFPVGTSISSLIQTKDMGYVIIGTYDLTGWIVKVDSSGKEQWNQTYKISNTDTSIRAAIQTSDGGYALTGSINPYSGAQYVWLAKIDSMGSMEWNQTYNNLEGGYPNAVIQMDDQGYTIAGTIYNFTNHSSSSFATKVDALGSVRWVQTYSNILTSMAKTSDKNIILAGLKKQDGISNGQLLKIDYNGALQWNRTFQMQGIWQVIECADGFALAGSIKNEAESNMALTKTDFNGNEQWVKSYGASDAYALLQTNDGFLLAGSSYFGKYAGDGWLVKTDLVGNMQLSQNYTDCYELVDIIRTGDGGYLLAGVDLLPMYDHSGLIIKTG
jgi:hypothetical protein